MVMVFKNKAVIMQYAHSINIVTLQRIYGMNLLGMELKSDCISEVKMGNTWEIIARKMDFGIGGSSSKSKKADGSSNLSGCKKGSVLIVDDDCILRTTHNAFLGKHGFETYVVVNGLEAVELCRSGSSFDLVLMDMEMPVKDGPTATWELRGMGVNSMIVGVTARGSDSEKQAFIEAGFH